LVTSTILPYNRLRALIRMLSSVELRWPSFAGACDGIDGSAEALY